MVRLGNPPTIAVVHLWISFEASSALPMRRALPVKGSLVQCRGVPVIFRHLSKTDSWDHLKTIFPQRKCRDTNNFRIIKIKLINSDARRGCSSNTIRELASSFWHYSSVAYWRRDILDASLSCFKSVLILLKRHQEECFLISRKILRDDSLSKIKEGFSYKRILLDPSLWSYTPPKMEECNSRSRAVEITFSSVYIGKEKNWDYIGAEESIPRGCNHQDPGDHRRDPAGTNWGCRPSFKRIVRDTRYSGTLGCANLKVSQNILSNGKCLTEQEALKKRKNTLEVKELKKKRIRILKSANALEEQSIQQTDVLNTRSRGRTKGEEEEEEEEEEEKEEEAIGKETIGERGGRVEEEEGRKEVSVPDLTSQPLTCRHYVFLNILVFRFSFPNDLRNLPLTADSLSLGHPVYSVKYTTTTIRIALRGYKFESPDDDLKRLVIKLPLLTIKLSLD
ncbi:hypothetical protein EAG_07455 [Camponotus floridanus]|uniref:Uncharacterized protein n=1 Tax=Camponotus floridanus TaxID=104421 RepID=E2ACJ9_CAMFO|nr:hypothetical protein EAG_07455 [Camponotus floridanus]